MAVDIDRLQIQIKADATSADRAVSNLADKIDKLNGSLGRLPVGTLDRLATSVSHLGTAMQTMRNIDARVFSGLATKINSLANIDNARLTQAANAIRHIGITLSNLGNVSQGAIQISEVAKNIAKLGGKNVTNAIANLPLLTRELNNMLTTLSRSPQVSRNIIDMTNALANLASQGRNISTVTNGMVNGLNRQSRAMNTARRSSFNLASAFGMLYAKYFLVMRAIKAFGKAITGTSDYLEAYNYYNVAFGKIADEWKHQYAKYGYENAEAYADSFTQRMNESLSKMSGLQVSVGADGTGLLTTTGMKNLGLNIKEVTQYASQLASVTNSVGQTGEVSLIAAESFTKLGADMSSLFNVDYASVMGNLQSGLIGQSRALYKYGIDITNATLQTYAYELGLSKAVSEMTQAEKMQLRMIAILDQSKVSWGDLANTINSPSNMLRQFKNNLSEVGNVLGQLFIPIMQKAMPVINGLTIALKNFFVNLASFMGIKLDLDSFGQGFSDLEDDTSDLAGNLDDIANSAKKATMGLGKFDELNNINTSSKNGSGSGVLGGSIDLTKEIAEAAEEYRKAWNEAYAKMENRAQDFANGFKSFFAPIENIVRDLFNGDFGLAGADVSNLVAGVFTFFSNAIKKVDWKEAGSDIGEFLRGINWVEVISSVGNFFEDLIDSAIDLWSGSFEAAPMETAIISALALAKFTGLSGVLTNKLNEALGGIALTKSATIALVVGVAIMSFKIGNWLYDHVPTIKEWSDALGDWIFKDGDEIAIARTVSISLTGLALSLGAARGITLLPKALASIGGLGNLLTLDMVGLVGETGLKSAGLLIGGSIIGGITAAIGGFSLGQWINELITGEEIDMSWSEQFNAIKESFSDGSWKEALKLWGDDIHDAFIGLAKEQDKWWDNHVQPLLDEVSEFWSIHITEPLKLFGEDVSNWWSKDIAPWFTLEKWTNLLSGPLNAVQDFWSDITGWFDEIGEKWNNLFGEKGAFMGGAASVVINSELRPVRQRYATGGFPEDGLFYANHTELVGQFSNGRTAVANNAQIISGIEGGVERAVANVLAPYLAQIAQNTRETADKEFGITEKQIFDANRHQAQDYTRRTGRPAFS